MTPNATVSDEDVRFLACDKDSSTECDGSTVQSGCVVHVHPSTRVETTVAGRLLDVTAANKVNGVVLTDTVTTYTGNTPQTGDSYARIGAAGAGLTNIDLPNQTMDITGTLSGAVNLPAIPANWITAAGVADALEKRLGFWGTITVATAFAGDATTEPYITSTSFSSALARAYEGLVVNCAEDYRKVERFDPATDKVIFPAGVPFSATPTGTCDVYILEVR
jgi:hypothetical protein